MLRMGSISPPSCIDSFSLSPAPASKPRRYLYRRCTTLHPQYADLAAFRALALPRPAAPA
eukprot:8377469-Pyramimonas_sp.AAC.1